MKKICCTIISWLLVFTLLFSTLSITASANYTFNKEFIYVLDEIYVDTQTNTAHIIGWAYYTKDTSATIRVWNECGGTCCTDKYRGDVNTSESITGNHGFDLTCATNSNGEFSLKLTFEYEPTAYKDNAFDTKIYAASALGSHTVSYSANGGSGAPAAQTKINGVGITLSTVIPTRSGYCFLGWSTAPDSTTIYTLAKGWYDTDADLTLYAVWQKEIEFGSYPQTKVTDKNTISALNACAGDWVSYDYYSGTGSVGSMTPSNYMKYKDVTYNGKRYRAVTFTGYRPSNTYYTASAENSYQDDNGYNTEEVYWFQYESIKWLVLDADTGLILCKYAIDSQAFSDTVYGSVSFFSNTNQTFYANNYAESTIRQWLNDDFYNTAFNCVEQQSIYTTNLSNSAYDSAYTQYSSAATSDKVFLLTGADVQNTDYGFETGTGGAESRQTSGTDYAKSQGLCTAADNGNCWWWLRTAGSASDSVLRVGRVGGITSGGAGENLSNAVDYTYFGVRPALTINLSSYNKIEFGSYPQTKVTDKNTISALNACAGDWVSYDYYSGTGSVGSMTPSNYMKYKDVTYNGKRYRAVTFTGYRPSNTYYTASAENSYQDDNGYNTGEVYWFQYEPIEWLVLDSATGLVLCKYAIDSQAFSDTIYGSVSFFSNTNQTFYANNYAESTIRQWLNDDFYNTAFNCVEQQSIYTTNLSNSAYDSAYTQYSSAATSDKVFLLTGADVQNTDYGFEIGTGGAESRRTVGTDYAKSQGLCTAADNGNCWWWLRTADSESDSVLRVGRYGGVNFGGAGENLSNVVDYTYFGVRPALTVNWLALNCSHTFTETVIQPTCTEQGYTTHTCTKCGITYTDSYTDATGVHTWDDGEITTAATCKTKGVKTYTCTVCSATKTEETALDSSNHTGGTEIKNAKTADCGTAGYTGDTYCKGCGVKTASGTAISATGDHAWNDGEITTAATCKTKGVKTYTCTVCSATKTEETALDPSNHTGDTEIRNAKAATATETGYTGDTYCLDCNALLSTGSVIPAEGQTIDKYKNGDIVEFGSYPQSEVTDETLKDMLTNLAGDTDTWTSYGYYSGTGARDDGSMTASDYMVYKDVVYNNNQYRGVYFTKYRPYLTGYTASAAGTNQSRQDDNGYYVNTIYWFKFDPIQWRVLDPTTGLVMSKTILDAQAYNNYVLAESISDKYDNSTYWGNSGKTYYTNNYEYSSIRTWLNEDFYNTAFSAEQQTAITTTTLDNAAYDTLHSAYSANSTNDKIFLLSWNDVLNTDYGFTSSATSSAGSTASRQTIGSAYAKSQGLWVYGNECSYWRLRSAGYCSYSTCYVSNYGSASYYLYSADDIHYGVRPALCFDSSSVIKPSTEECEHTWDSGATITAATCKTKGMETFTCILCGETKTEEIEIDLTNHTGGTEIRNAKAVTETETGYTGDIYCLGCGTLLSTGSVIQIGGQTVDKYQSGDIVEFGYYPQSEVTDEALKIALTELAGETDTWTSYGYYAGNGETDGSMTASDYMVYKDVVYNNNKYRGVYFTEYRPYLTFDAASTMKTDDNCQDDNGYDVNTVYWFKYDPIRWRILDPTTGLVMSETILDAQAYNNYVLCESVSDPYQEETYWGNSSKTYYANNYEYSSIRAWLNEDFYSTAFSTEQQKIIATTTIDNAAYDASYSAYNANSTNDKIFLLSLEDTTNTDYGFSSDCDADDTSRQAMGSAYAKSQGLYVDTESVCSCWHLRTAGSGSGSICDIYFDGCALSFFETFGSGEGVRPALCFDLESSIIQYPVACTHTWDDGEITTAATCKTKGVKTYTCTVCSATKTEEIALDSTNHTGGTEIKNAKTATCGTAGYTGDTYCKGCGVKTKTGIAIPATGDHTWNDGVVTTAATCKTKGVKTFTCTVCGAIKTESIDINPENHTGISDWIIYDQPTCVLAGRKYKECPGCKTVLVTEEIPATGNHTWNDGEVTTAATCKTKGVKTYTCKVCSATKTEETALDSTNHTGGTEIKNAKTATCGTAGYTGDTYCKGCGVKTKTGTAIPATGDHTYDDGVITKETSCFAKGIKTFTCTVCGSVKNEDIAQTSHTPADWLTDYDATCTDGGSRHKECLYCHEVLVREAIPALGHHDHNGDGDCDTCGINMEDYLRSICSCNCHKSGFAKFIWKILNFFYKLFGIKQYCSCGAKHW